MLTQIGENKDDTADNNAKRATTPKLKIGLATLVFAILIGVSFHIVKSKSCFGLAAFVILLLLMLCLNVHYLLFEGTYLKMCLISSKCLLSTVNGLGGRFISNAMTKAGIPKPNRTERYGMKNGIPLLLDVYEPPSSSEDSGRPVLLYFHAGAFVWGFREFGRHVCAWIAEERGVVGISASYRLAHGGNGVAGAIDDAWTALQWVQSHAELLKIDPKKIVVMGDSAGALLTAALATGLHQPNLEPTPHSELPAAAIIGWGAITLQGQNFIPSRGPDGLGETSEAEKFDVPCIWVPKGRGDTQADCQTHLNKVIAGEFLAFGLNKNGWLPASTLYDDNHARSISPLSLAARPGLPPMFAYSGGADEIVPCSQQELFVERYRSGGNSIAHLIFAEAVHGGGGINCPAGREAMLKFLEHHKIIPPAISSKSDAGVYVDSFMRVLKTKTPGYDHIFDPKQHINSTLHLPATSEAAVPKEKQRSSQS